MITLRNLTWDPVTYQVDIGPSIGLATKTKVTVLQLHPTEKRLAHVTEGATVPVEVLPFRACLILATADPLQEIEVAGCDYQVVRDVAGTDGRVRLLGRPGTTATVSLNTGTRKFAAAHVDGKAANALLKGKSVEVTFPGTTLKDPWHRHIGTPAPCPVPADAEAIYETTVFAADNDPLEMRSIRRSGPSSIPQVQKARQMFLDQEMIATRGIWDRFLFDDDPETVYNFDKGFGIETERVIRLDLGRAARVDTLLYVLPTGEDVPNGRAKSGVSRRVREDHWAEVSSDLKTWRPASFVQLPRNVQMNIGSDQPIRYIRTNFIPPRVVEILGQAGGKTLDRAAWRCSFFFRPYGEQPAIKAWSHTFTLNEVSEGAYLCIALEGLHGKEGAYAALRVGDKIMGAPTRATSYPSNVWEYPVPRSDSHYTYYIPVTKEMVGQRLEAIVLGMDPAYLDFKPEVWLTAYAPPYTSQELVLGVE